MARMIPSLRGLDICSGGRHLILEMLRDRLLSQYDAYPFRAHPYWRAVGDGTLLHSQVAAAEQQHVLQLRAAAECERRSYLGVAGEQAFMLFLDQYLDALSSSGAADQLAMIAVADGPSSPTPATSASIALRADVRARGFAFYAVGFGFVSHFYAQLCADANRAYRSVYRLSEQQLAYYREHERHERARAHQTLAALDELANGVDHASLELAVRDAMVTASFGFDGMLQAATNSRTYWSGQ
jgi:hypothetical protein